MVISRRWAGFLILAGVWNWLIWPRFGVAIWNDERSFEGGAPTSFLWIHALLIAASLVIGTTVAVFGVRAWRASNGAEESTARPGAGPQD